MQEFRRFVKGPIGKVLLVAIILPFVISAFYGYFTGGNQGDTVAEVNGNPISKRQLDARVRQYRQAMKRQRPNLDSSMLERFINPSMVLQGMVTNELLFDYAKQSGMAVAEEQTARKIRSQQAFRNENGEFSRQIFEQRLRTAGISPGAYVENLKRQILQNQVRTGFQETAFGLPGELARRYRLREQTRDLRYVLTRPSELISGYSVDDAAVKKYYRKHSDQFMQPPRFKLAYVELSPEDYRDRIKVTEEDIRREYEARKQAGTLTGRARQGREARHILLKTGDQRSEKEALARAMELRQRIKEGASFADVARRNSEDAATADRGGSLGTVRKGDLPSSLEEALFSLDPGQVSEPVVTDAGVHLIKRGESDKNAKTPSLADKREEIARELLQGRIQSRLTEDASRLDQLAFEHTDLQTPAEKLDLEIQKTDWFTLDNPKGIATNAAVREAMQTPEVRDDGQNSELLEVGKRRLVIRIADRKPEQPHPLAEVADQIRSRIKQQRARQALDRQAETVRQQLEKGAGLERIATRLERSVETAKDVRRNARQPSTKMVKRAFSLPRPGDGGASGPELVRLADGGLGVVAVTGVTDGEPSQMSEKERTQALSRLERTQGRQTLRSLIAWLRAEGKVDIKEKVLQGDKGGQGASAAGGSGNGGGGTSR